MSRYLLRRLLIAIPSVIGISIVLFTVLLQFRAVRRLILREA
jgi:ABC-type microcin C transport system permease subunit YejB